MGNEQSTQKKRQKANAAETKVQNGELNGHAVPPPDLTETVAGKVAEQQKSEIPPATNKNEAKSAPGKEEVDKGKGPVTSPETDTTTETAAELPNQDLKPTGEEVTNFFGKMFKKKAELVKPASESKDSVDGQSTDQSDIVIINSDQEETPDEAAENLHLQLIDTIPTQPIVEEHTRSRSQTKNISLESSSTNVEALTFFEVLPEPVSVAEESLIVVGASAVVSEQPMRGDQHRKMHIENSTGEELGVDAQVPISLKYEEPTTADAEQALTEDKELIKMVEMIISDGEEQLMTNVPESVTVEPKFKGDLVVESEDGIEGPLLVAEEIAAIVEEILQITEDQVLGVTQKQQADAEETTRQVNEAEESGVIAEELRNNFMETLDVAEAPEMLSVESAVIVEDQMTVESILAADGTAAVDEESWVIIEEPAPPHNKSTHTSAHPGGLEEHVTSPATAAKEWSSKDSESDLAKLFSHLRSVCTKAVEGSSYKPVSVDVCGNESEIHITIQVCQIDKDEIGNNTENDFTCKIQEIDVHCSTEPVAIKASTEAEPEGAALELLDDLADVAEEISQSEDAKAAEKTVMNFFKTFVSPTKTSKEAKATPDASKDQSQKEAPPAPSANVQEAPKAPPPPPPAPPKMEGKAEPAVKKEETTAAAAAEGSKTKPKDSAFSKLFRPKSVVLEEKKPVEVQVDASKTSTLEAAAKPDEPPAPKPEEKKQEKKSTFGSMFKPKAPEPKKETPAAPAVAASVPVAKAKEEPKPAAPAAQDNKSAGSTDNASPSSSRKLEKRNSIQLFFKTLGQKRHSDAGVQTDPVVPEKAK